MVGNVFGWTEDCRHNYYNGAPTDGSAGSQTATASIASSAAVPGSALRTSSARRTATGSPPTTDTSASAFGWGGRFLPLESLSLCLLGVWGRSPQRLRLGIEVPLFFQQRVDDVIE
jgi:hypothetical protein